MLTRSETLSRIADEVSLPAALEGMAEECAELGACALKLARIIRKDNPTPADAQEVASHISEEMGNVENYIEIAKRKLGVSTRKGSMAKLNRWVSRLNGRK